MAVQGATQALVGAFSLGVLLAASSASFILIAWRHAAKVLRDGLRLALISFLALIAAWALTGFITTAANSRSRPACQVSVVFATLFDQFARFSVEQFLLWAAPANGAPKALQIGSQVFLLARLGLGIAYAGLIRPAFNPTCVPQIMVPYIAVILIIVDAVIVVLLAIRAISTGAAASRLSTQSAKQNKSVFLSIAGLAIWMGMSVTYLLGLARTGFIFRTAIPAAGATILILILMLFSAAILAEHDASRPGTTSRSISSPSQSLEAPPINYEDLKQDNQNGLPFISRNADGTFPSISRPMQNAPTAFPQQSYTAPVAELGGGSKSPWGRFFSNDARKAPKRPLARQLTISRPVVHDDPNNEHNPLRRIQTIDLATARQQDQERRLARAATSPDLIARRPAPEPPRPSTAGEYLSANPSNLVIRKKPLRATAPPGVLSSDPLDLPAIPKARLDVEPYAASTSMQLSPGVEAMRRRSPRQGASRPVTLAATTPRRPLPEVPYQSSPQAAFKFATTPSVPPKGLPRNPRAGPRAAPAPHMQVNLSPAVMLVGDIIYEDPDTVRNVFHKKANSAPNFNHRTGSVVHRPRPIPRNRDYPHDFLADSSFPRGHRRSISTGSIVTSKSILYVNPGNPTLLPPLPEPPRSADSARFSANLIKNASQRTSRRSVEPARASPAPERDAMVEDLRRAQEQLRNTQQQASNPNSDPKPLRYSAATMKESVRTMSIFGFEDGTQQQETKEDDSSSLGTETAKDLTSNNDSWRQEDSPEGRSSIATHQSQRRSSPVIPDFRQLPFSPFESAPPTATTAWDMPSAVHMAVSKHQAHSTYIHRDKAASSPCSGSGGDPCVGDITVMLDDGPVYSAGITILTAVPHIESELAGVAPTELDCPESESPTPTKFHRQIGDECPCFSTRKSALLKRRVPPPPPLPLSMRTRPVIIRTAEPSPLESPEEAYQMIQRQLENLDRLQGTNDGKTDHEIDLLADLEAEMGLQENRWHDLHDNMERGSISTYASSPCDQSYPPSSIARSSVRESHGSLAASYGVFLQPGRASTHMPVKPTNLSSSLEYLRASNKERLSQAEWYMQDSARLSARSNGTTITKIAMADLGSPSPPDTNESDFEIEFDDELDADSPMALNNFPVVPKSSLIWQPRANAAGVVSEQLWVAPVEVPSSPNYFAELADIPVFVRTRRFFDEPLFISSSRLWVKPTAMKIARPGLWQKAEPLVVRSQSRAKLPPRPLTVRPPRRPKRISQLADIMESPKPLPHKRETLGFFQFPWGEKSEHPVVFQRPGRLTAMPGTMSTGTSPMSAILEARSQQLAAQEQAMQALMSQQQASDATSPSARSDDEFDENTLWEIASLLRVDHVPSRESMFPSLDEYENDDGDFDMDDYEAEMFSDNDEDDEEETDESGDDELPSFFEIVSASPISVVASIHSPSGVEPEPSLLWNNTSGAYQKSPGFGLNQPTTAQWSAYMQTISDRPVFRHLNEAIVEIESDSLWQTSSEIHDKTSVTPSLLWTTPTPALSKAIVAVEVLTATEVSSSASLWTGPAATESKLELGLNQPKGVAWEAYMTESANRPVHRHLGEQHAGIKSRALWASPERKVQALDKKLSLWSRGTVRPAPAQASLWVIPRKSESIVQRPTFGLAQPEASRWQTYIKDEEERSVIRQQPGELDLLQSNTMWGIPESQPLFEEPESLLWGQTVASTPFASRDVTLWTKAADIEYSAMPEGLFSAISQVRDRKRTSRQLSTAVPVRAAVQRHESLPQIESTSLWSKNTAQQAREGLWMTAKSRVTVIAATEVRVPSSALTSVTRPASITRSSPASLWMGKSKTNESEDAVTTGLWSFCKPAYATATEPMFFEPFSVNLARKQRMLQEPLVISNSSQLWTAPQKNSARRASSSHSQDKQLWSMPASTSRKPKSELKNVWTRSIIQPSRVQSFAAEDDFFNHFGGAPSRRQTLYESQQAAHIVEVDEEELPPRPSNSSWLSTWGWKKGN
ncbi:hypothetical protein MN608_01233 [Microdochium nivale]|nr:hypothetical protein MN608_01233 [Microdochium nivale]